MAGKATGKAQGRSRPQTQGKSRQGKQNPERRNEQRGKSSRPEARGREQAQGRNARDEGQEQSQQEPRQGGAAGVSKVADTAKQHPITTAAIGAGLTLLAAQGLRMAISSMSGNGAAGSAAGTSRGEEDAGDEEDSPEGSYSGDEGEQDREQDDGSDEDRPEGSAGEEDQGDEEGEQEEGEEDDEGGGGFGSRFRGVGSALRISGDAIRRGAKSGFDRGRQSADQNWQTHPLMLCGLALAVGAAAGFLLPSTRQEDQMMGESSDKVTGRLKDTGQKFFRQGRQIAGKVVSEAVSTTTREAEREGLTPDRLGRKVKRVFGSVRNAVSEAVQDD